MRLRPLLPALFGALVVSSACSVDATAPSSLAASRAIAASADTSGGQAAQEVGAVSDGNGAYWATIDPARPNRLSFGAHTLYIPPNALCSADESGYGPEVFDEECARETMPVTITATVSSDANGRPRIILGPEMRFSPDKKVILSLSVESGVLASTTSWNILYCPGTGFENCVDESILDPSLAADIDLKHGTVSRRIKHFSGYYLVE